MPYIMTQMKLASLQDPEGDGTPLIRYEKRTATTDVSKGPFFRPLFFEYPEDRGVISAPAQQWRQFMFGNGILVAPVLAAEATTMDVYFPRGSWYEVWSGLNYMAPASRWQKIEALYFQIPSYIRGGTILPTLVIPLFSHTL